MIPDLLHVHYLQTSLHWEDYPANEAHFQAIVNSIQGPADLILFPEMWGTGYSMSPQRVAQKMDGAAVTWMHKVAIDRQAVVMGSLAIEEDGQYFNRIVCCEPDGVINYYDKRHLFTYAGEQNHYSPGNHHLLITLKGWRILPLVCYDLRFPVWSRNTHGYDVLIYLANWPTPRVNAWTSLLKARAIENQAYVVGVNRIGSDANGNAYPGRSAVYDMGGEPLIESGQEEEVGTITLSYATLKAYRERFAFLPDMDQFHLL